MKIRTVKVLEIENLKNIRPLIGESIDYLIINKDIKDDFENHEDRLAIIPMLKQGGKILYV